MPRSLSSNICPNPRTKAKAELVYFRVAQIIGKPPPNGGAKRTKSP
jgi:hypothetical protein